MATNFRGDGNTVVFTAAATLASGDLVAFPADDDTAHLVGVTHAAYASGATDAVAVVEGEFEVTKATGTAWAIGDLIYLNTGTQTCSETAAGNAFVGVAMAAAASGDVLGRVKINAGGREV